MLGSDNSGALKRRDSNEEDREARSVQVELHTEGYTIIGFLTTRHERLQDLLRNYFHPFLNVKGATIIHRQPWGRPKTEQVGDVMVRLDEVALAIPHVDIPEGERERSSHPQYVPKHPVQGVIHLHRTLVEGQIFMREGEEAEFAMMASPERFFAVKRARVSYPYHDDVPSFAAEVVIVNRDRVQLLRRV